MTYSPRSAKITFKDKVAGRLEETAAGGTRFVYDTGWQNSIGCCLPVTRREHEWPSGLHPFFQHLGAEGWLRERQARLEHLVEDDDLGLLLRYGGDCIGAVGIMPAKGEPLVVLPANEATNPGRTISGVQRKLLVIRDEAMDSYRSAGPTGPAQYIAKFNSDDLPTLVRNENLSLRWLTAVLGAGEVTEFRLARVADLDETALVVSRFDRTTDGRKLRAEDFAQILRKPRGADFAGKYEASYEDVANVIRDHSARVEIDLARFFRRLVAYVLMANCDAHLKNFTLLERPEGLRLSPAYDVVNIGVYAEKGVSQRLGLAIGNEFVMLDAVTRLLLCAFGQRIGLSKALIDQTFNSLKSKVRQAEKWLPDPGDDGRDRFGAEFTRIVRDRCLKLLEP